jgi:hypothetical protein
MVSNSNILAEKAVPADNFLTVTVIFEKSVQAMKQARVISSPSP